MGLASLRNQQTFPLASAHRGSPRPAPGSAGGSAGTAGTDPGAPLALGGVSFLSAAQGTRGSPHPGLTGRAEPGPPGAAAPSPRAGQDPTPRRSGERGPCTPHPLEKETGGDQPDRPYTKNCQMYGCFTKVELLFFYFWSLQREQNTGWGGRWGVPLPRGRLGRGCHLCARPGPLSAGRVSSSPAGTPEGCPRHGRGDTDLVLGIPPVPGGWHHRDGGHRTLLPTFSPRQFSPDPVGLLGCPLKGLGPWGPLTGTMGGREGTCCMETLCPWGP